MPITKAYIAEIKQILREARNKAFTAVNYAMVEAYWLIGKRIVEEIQQGEHRANYGDQVIKNISKALTAEFGKGFSERSIRQYRQFYQMFPKLSIRRSVFAKLIPTFNVQQLFPFFFLCVLGTLASFA